MPSRSEVTCAPADFPDADLKEPFIKNAFGRLTFRSLVVFASRKKLSIAKSPYVSLFRVVGAVEELQMV